MPCRQSFTVSALNLTCKRGFLNILVLYSMDFQRSIYIHTDMVLDQTCSRRIACPWCSMQALCTVRPLIADESSRVYPTVAIQFLNISGSGAVAG